MSQMLIDFFSRHGIQPAWCVLLLILLALLWMYMDLHIIKSPPSNLLDHPAELTRWLELEQQTQNANQILWLEFLQKASSGGTVIIALNNIGGAGGTKFWWTADSISQMTDLKPPTFRNWDVTHDELPAPDAFCEWLYAHYLKDKPSIYPVDADFETWPLDDEEAAFVSQLQKRFSPAEVVVITDYWL